MRLQYLNIGFLVIFTAALFSAHIAVLAVGDYYKIWWADNVLHFSGGFLAGSFALWFIFNSGRFLLPTEKLPTYIIVITVLGFAALIGTLWEFMEFIMDEIIGYKSYSPIVMMENFKDTISDLFFDLLGALTANIFLKLPKIKEFIPH